MPSPFLDAPVDSLDPRQAGRVFLPPAAAAIYLHADNNLQLTAFNAAASVELAVRVRILLPTGQEQVQSERLVPSTSRAISTLQIVTGEGWLLGATVFAVAGSPRIGQCFAVLDVVRGDNASPLVVASVLQGYVTDTQRLAWPGSPIMRSVDGPGVLRSVTGTDFPANNEILEQVPTNARWRLHAVQFTLVTDANVANREVALAFNDGVNVFARVPSGFNHAASTTVVYSAFFDAQRNTVATDTTRNIPLPRLDLQGGMQFGTLTTNRQAGDNFGAPQYLVEEWIED